MSRILFAGLAAALVFAATPSVQAEFAGGRHMVAEAALKKLVDRRIDILKTTLSLTPDQQKLWPAVEDAIRARAAQRHDRVTKLIKLAGSEDETNAIELMRNRAAALAAKATALKNLADAWEPLYTKLDENQKERLAFVAAYAVRELRDAAARRLMAADEEGEDDED